MAFDALRFPKMPKQVKPTLMLPVDVLDTINERLEAQTGDDPLTLDQALASIITEAVRASRGSGRSAKKTRKADTA